MYQDTHTVQFLQSSLDDLLQYIKGSRGGKKKKPPTKKAKNPHSFLAVKESNVVCLIQGNLHFQNSYFYTGILLQCLETLMIDTVQ